MLTRKGMDAILRKIAENSEMYDGFEDDVLMIQNDFDEKDEVLRRYGTVEYGEEDDEYEYKESSVLEDAKVAEEWKGKYEDMRAKYIDRFFGTAKERDEYTTVLNETETDIKRDGTEQTFDELLYRAEG